VPQKQQLRAPRLTDQENGGSSMSLRFTAPVRRFSEGRDS
jgi:hypothetical protein